MNIYREKRNPLTREATDKGQHPTTAPHAHCKVTLWHNPSLLARTPVGHILIPQLEFDGLTRPGGEGRLGETAEGAEGHAVGGPVGDSEVELWRKGGLVGEGREQGEREGRRT